MNRYFQKILEIKFHLLLNLVYTLKFPSLWSETAPSTSGPLISIVVPIYKPKLKWLTECVNSISGQNYQNWQLILVDDNSSDSAITQYLQNLSDRRIKVIVNNKNLNIVGTTNVGLQAATGDWVGFLDHDDILWPQALSLIANAINNNSDIQFIYTDQDKIDDSSHHFDPFLKPDFDSNLLLQTNYLNHFSVISKELLTKLNNLRPDTDGAQDWDLALRSTNFYHLPKILYSWRVSQNSSASTSGSRQNKYQNVQQAVLNYNYPNIKFTQTRYIGIWSANNQSTFLPYQFHLRSLLNLIAYKK